MKDAILYTGVLVISLIMFFPAMRILFLTFFIGTIPIWISRYIGNRRGVIQRRRLARQYKSEQKILKKRIRLMERGEESLPKELNVFRKRVVFSKKPWLFWGKQPDVEDFNKVKSLFEADPPHEVLIRLSDRLDNIDKKYESKRENYCNAIISNKLEELYDIKEAKAELSKKIEYENQRIITKNLNLIERLRKFKFRFREVLLWPLLHIWGKREQTKELQLDYNGSAASSRIYLPTVTQHLRELLPQELGEFALGLGALFLGLAVLAVYTVFDATLVFESVKVMTLSRTDFLTMLYDFFGIKWALSSSETIALTISLFALLGTAYLYSVVKDNKGKGWDKYHGFPVGFCLVLFILRAGMGALSSGVKDIKVVSLDVLIALLWAASTWALAYATTAEGFREYAYKAFKSFASIIHIIFRVLVLLIKIAMSFICLGILVAVTIIVLPFFILWLGFYALRAGLVSYIGALKQGNTESLAAILWDLRYTRREAYWLGYLRGFGCETVMADKTKRI